MKMLTIISILFLMPLTANAEWEHYSVEKPDGSVHTIGYDNRTNKSLADNVKELGFEGFPIIRVTVSDMPSPTKVDRKYWKMNDVPIGKKIVIDNVKKQIDLDANADKKAKKDAVKQKICNSCTDEEWDDLFS